VNPLFSIFLIVFSFSIFSIILEKIFKPFITKKTKKFEKQLGNLFHPNIIYTKEEIKKNQELALVLNLKLTWLKLIKQSIIVLILFFIIFPFLRTYYVGVKPLQIIPFIKDIPWLGTFGWFGTFIIISILMIFVTSKAQEKISWLR